MIEIESGSQAGSALLKMLDDPGTYLVRIEVRTDGLALKRNEGVWSPTLTCALYPARPPQQPRSFILGDEDNDTEEEASDG